jgi:hypothetical protein
VSECRHKYVHLRTERSSEEFEHVTIWKLVDVFFCKKCLNMQFMPLEQKTRRGESAPGWYLCK